MCILFFAATGRNGEDLFDPALALRSGEYQQYHHGDINALHVSYFRRRWPEERAFHTCNLRKSYGFQMVAQGADPIPSVEDADPPYRIQLVKCGADVAFFINDLPIFDWRDDGVSYGPALAGRQDWSAPDGPAHRRICQSDRALGLPSRGQLEARSFERGPAHKQTRPRRPI